MKEKGDAKKKTRSAASSGRCSKQTGAAATKKKRKKKSAVESPKNKGKQQANFSPDEDFMLCSCAYINVSVDPIVSAGQKSETPFWTRVLEKYLLLTERYLADNGDELPVRNSASLQHR